ncbi:TetR/AcrR family transcriptional regulator [Nocardia stercoris]|uniref:TetR/AcrR family transcriptional regulator n=1 Tax=Nocardia stercoris TaxID=2483361 RepID=A0A3M2LC91_9NOCA|nr:TetR family transcriptional regulator [Nocardia stercoris]RMI35014.1 TetR/AcrR family transcriptional regulator [Nocardia stercoris]
MRSIRRSGDDPTEDLSTRARIRDAAIGVFATEGFAVGVRAIAAAAGVSPGLVNHHFGSKDGLRATCDDYVRSVIRASKTEYLERPTPQGLLQSLADIEGFAPYIAYLMRHLQDGGPLAVALIEQMISDTEGYLRTGIAAGTLRPIDDVPAMARYMALQNGGGLLLFLRMYQAHHPGPLDFRAVLREYSDAMLLPGLEIYTDGLLTDSMALQTLRDTTT